jgi:hypothetical protein
MLKYITVTLFLFSLFSFSCSNQGEEETVLAFEVIHSGPYTSVTEKKEFHASNNDEYMKLMNEIYADLDQMPKIPEVDFSKNDVGAVFMGQKSSGGYSINFDKIIKRSGAVSCNIYETSPGKGCMLTQGITYPYEIVKTPKLNKKIKFVYKQRTQDCQ